MLQNKKLPLSGYLLSVILNALSRLSENFHLPFDKPFDKLTVLSKVEGLMALSKAQGPFGRLTALSKAEGLRYPHPSSLRRTSMYASFLGISEALHLGIFHQPLRSLFSDSLIERLNTIERW